MISTLPFYSGLILTAVMLQKLTANPLPTKPYLLVCLHDGVYKMNMDGSGQTMLATGTGAYSVDFHYQKNKMFWSNFADGTIRQADLDGSNAQVIVSHDAISKPNGVAVDWINDRVYFSFNSPDSQLDYPNHLAFYDMTSGTLHEITGTISHYQGLNNPRTPITVFRDMAVDPVAGNLYWSSGFEIVKSGLLGGHPQVIYSEQCVISFFDLNEKLYLAETFCRDAGVRSIDLSTSQDTAIVNQRGYYNGVTAYDGHVYWTGLGTIRSAPDIEGAPVGNVIRPYSHGVAFFKGIKAVHPDRQPPQ